MTRLLIILGKQQKPIISICYVNHSYIKRKNTFLIYLNRNYHVALKTALRLVLYEKELEAKEVYRLISLDALLNKSFKECSKALFKLENLPNITREELENYQNLAISLFTTYDPQNQKEISLKCPGKN